MVRKTGHAATDRMDVMLRRRGKHEAMGPCHHWRKTVVNNAGLQFVICRSCKQVSVHYLHAMIEDDIILPEEAMAG